MERRLFEVQTAHDGDRLTLSVAGEIDLATVGGLSDALGAATRSGADQVWVDLTDVSFLDSTGLSALVIANRAVAGGLVVICPDGAARRALDVSGLSELMRVCSTVADAG